jgi:hypothetical protein
MSKQANLSGWVHIHRKLLEWEWYDDMNTFRVFIHLLLKASFREGAWRGHAIPEGSLIIGRHILAKETRLSEQSVRTALEHLKSTNEVTIESTKQFSLVKINNWAKYQDTNQPINQRPTNDQPTTNHIVRREEGKNVRIEPPTPLRVGSVDKMQGFQEFWRAYPRKTSKAAAQRAWAKICPPAELQATIMASLSKHTQSAQWTKDGGQYVPHPATWLNQERWDDVMPEGKKTTGRAFIDGDPARYDEGRDIWMVCTAAGQWVTCGLSKTEIKQKLIYK